jgi:hypothetical protein
MSDEEQPVVTSGFVRLASSGRAWFKCKYCSGSEDGPHEPNCPGDTVAMLLRIQNLERLVQELRHILEAGE